MNLKDIMKQALDESTSLSTEMIQAETFRKNFTSYLISHIGSRYIQFSNIDLPTRSIVHMIDGFVKENIEPTNPPLYSFFNNLFGRPYFTNVVDFDPATFAKYKGVKYFPNSIKPLLMKFRARLVKKFNVTKTVTEAYTKQFKYLILNYQPVSTLYTVGQKTRAFHEYELLMSTLIDNINKAPADTRHYVCLPINTFIDPSMLMMYLMKDEVRETDITLSRPADNTFMFMLDILMYFSGHTLNNLQCSFNNIDKNRLQNVNIMFVSQDYEQTCIGNMKALKDIILRRNHYKMLIEYIMGNYKFVDNSVINTIVNETNTIVESGVNVGDEQDMSTDINPVTNVKKNDTTIKEEITESTPEPKPTEPIIQEVKQPEITYIKEIKAQTPLKVKQVQKNVMPVFTDDELMTEPIVEFDDNEIKELETEIDKESAELYDMLHEFITKEPLTEDMNISDIEQNSTVDITKSDREYAKNVNLSEHISNAMQNTLKRDDQLTPKQKERAQALFQKTLATTITIDGKQSTVANILDRQSVSEITSVEAPINQTFQLDKTLNKQTVMSFNETYRKDILNKDIVSSLVSFSQNGLFLSDYEEVVENDSFNRVRHITAKFDSSNGKRHTIRFKIPISDDVMVINGIKYNLRMQQVNLPICKVSDTRVSLVSNFNKTLIEKISYLRKSISNSIQKTLSKNPKLSESYNIIVDTNIYKGKRLLPSDYTSIAHDYTLIENKEYILYFNYENVYDYFEIDKASQEIFDGVYNKRGSILIGKSRKNKEIYLFMNVKSNLVEEVNITTKTEIRKRTILSYVFPDISDHTDIIQPVEFCHLKILDKNIPIIAILGYRYGLLNILKEKGIKYRLVQKRHRITTNAGDIVIPFKDYSMVFNRYPLTTSLLLNGLSVFDTKNFNIAEMNNPSTYFELFNLKGIKTNYLKGINSFFDFFVDPITFDVLTAMGEPVTPKGLLLRGIEMLSTSKYVEPSEMVNARLRGDEKIPAVIYNEISRQYSQYLNDKRRDTTFSINTESIFQRIVQDNAVVLNEDVNPMHELKTKTSVTHLGFGGRSEEAFVESDRKFPRDGLGIVSESTPDSGKVALNFNVPPNANITNTRGMVKITDDPESLDPSNIMSAVGLTIPGTFNNDYLWST